MLNPIHVIYTLLYTIIEKIIEEHYPKLLQLLFNIETEPYSTVYVSPCMLRHAKGFKASRLVS